MDTDNQLKQRRWLHPSRWTLEDWLYVVSALWAVLIVRALIDLLTR